MMELILMSLGTALVLWSSVIKPIMYIFILSLAKGIFPDDLKIARVTPVFKAGNENDRPISILPCFSKILEKIMYNRLFKYLTSNEILYKKQFGFRRGTLRNML